MTKQIQEHSGGNTLGPNRDVAHVTTPAQGRKWVKVTPERGNHLLEAWLYTCLGELNACCALMRNRLAANPDLELLTLDFASQVMAVATDMLERVNTLLAQSNGDMATDAPDMTAFAPFGCLDPLTPSEIQVLRYLGAGLRPNSIAMQSGLAIDTVRMHIRQAMSKLHVHRYMDAVRVAQEQGILGTTFP